MVTEKMIEALKPCPNCGGKERSWFPANKINTTAQDGRLKSNEVSCDFVLGCDECSETLRVVSADEIASRMTSALSTDAEPVCCGKPVHEGSPEAYTLECCGNFVKPAPSVAVKALEWVKTVDTHKGSQKREQWMAQTPWGGLFIWHYGPKFTVGSMMTAFAPTEIEYETLDEAKAAAQADYEARIRSALSAQVQDVAAIRQAALEDAAKLVESQWNHCWPSDIATSIRALAAAPAAKQDGKP